jgi:hypothetical protein
MHAEGASAGCRRFGGREMHALQRRPCCFSWRLMESVCLSDWLQAICWPVVSGLVDLRSRRVLAMRRGGNGDQWQHCSLFVWLENRVVFILGMLAGAGPCFFYRVFAKKKRKKLNNCWAKKVSTVLHCRTESPCVRLHAQTKSAAESSAKNSWADDCRGRLLPALWGRCKHWICIPCCCSWCLMGSVCLPVTSYVLHVHVVLNID